MHYFSKFILLFLLGWKFKGEFPDNLKQYVVIAAPHTSWVDIPLGLLIRSITKTDIHFVAKKSLFNKPHGFLFKWLGGFPIDRSKSNNTVDLLIEKFKENENFILGISPEGTRQKVTSWKTGFYYTAKGANVPIVPVILDFKNKLISIKQPYYTSYNVEKDINKLKNYYQKVEGKHTHLT